MSGSLEQRGDQSWRLVAFAGWDPSTKKRQYVRRTVHGTKREAAKALAALVTEVSREQRAGINRRPDPLSLADVLDKWLTARSSVLSPATVDRYRVAIKHVEQSGLGALAVVRLRPHHIEDLYTELLAKGQSGSSIRKGPLGDAAGSRVGAAGFLHDCRHRRSRAASTRRAQDPAAVVRRRPNSPGIGAD